MTRHVPTRFAALAALATLLPAQGAVRQPLVWEPSLAAAQARAQRLRRPVVALLLPPAKTGVAGLLPGGERRHLVTWLLREVVLLPAAREEHAGEAPPGFAGRCPLCPTVTCAEHQAAWGELEKRYLPGGIDPAALPLLLFLAPEGRLLRQKGVPSSPEELLRLLKEALDEVDPGWWEGWPGLPQALRDAGLKLPAGPSEARPKKYPLAEGAGAAVPWSGLFSERQEVRLETMLELLELKDLGLVRSLFGQLSAPAARVELLRLLAEPGEAGQVPFLLGVLQEKGLDPEVRVHAALSLEVVGRRDAEAQDLIGKALRAERDEARQAELCLALGAVAADAREAAALLKPLATDRDERVRLGALAGLAALPEGAPGTAEAMRKALKDPRPRVALAGAMGLVRLGVPRLEDELRHLRAKFPEWQVARQLGALRDLAEGKRQDGPQVLQELRAWLLEEFLPRPPKRAREWLQGRK